MSWLFALTVALAAPSSPPKAPEAPAPPPLERTLTLTEFSVDPLRLDIPAGAQVRLVIRNVGTVTHSFRIDDLPVATDPLQPGATQVVVFRAPAAGRFVYTCGIPGHDEVGTPGRLVVEEAVSALPPAPAEAPWMGPPPEPSAPTPEPAPE